MNLIPHRTFLYTLALIVTVIVFALQSNNIGFENGHHGWPSVHGLAIYSHVSPESRFVGHAQVFVEEDGTLAYDYFDRYPLFFGAFMRLFFEITDDMPTEIMIFRQVMNVIFLLTMFAAYRLVRLFVDEPLLAFGITVTAFSSFYLTYYKDMIHYDPPALLGMLWLLVTIGRYKLGRGKRWHVYAVALAAVALGRGYASLFVLGVWFLVDSIAVLFGEWRTMPLRTQIKAIFTSDAFRVMVLAIAWATLLLSYNIYAEIAIQDSSLRETSIFNSARRRLPFFNNALDGTETLSETGISGWGDFALVQFQRTVLWFAPLKLGGEMGWRFIPGEYEVEFSLWRTLAAAALYAIVIVFAIKQDKPHRELVLISAFGGLLWIFFMINLSAKHIYVSMYSLGLTLMAWVALLGWIRRSVWLVRGLVVVGMLLFVGSNWQARATLTEQSNTLDEYTWDFNRIQESVNADSGTVYLAYGYYRPWCIINNNQCYVLGYYLSEYTLTRHYEQSDFVLSPRRYHIAPQFVDANETLDLLIPVRADNEVAYFMDRAASQPRTAPPENAPQFYFGDAITLQDWSINGDVTLSRCDSVHIESWWLAEAVPNANMNMQIVMVDSDGGAITEANNPLGLFPTRLWELNKFTFDSRTITVPCDTPAGEYPLIMGVYNPDTLAPLEVSDGEGNIVGNQIYLTTLFVQ